MYTYVMKSEVVSVRLERKHKDLFQQLIPHFGSTEGEVIRNLAIRWLENHISDPNLEIMADCGLIQKGFSKNV